MTIIGSLLILLVAVVLVVGVLTASRRDFKRDPEPESGAADWLEEAALSEEDEVQRFENQPRRFRGSDYQLHHPSFYEGKVMDWEPSGLRLCTDAELVEPLSFKARREPVAA